MASLKGYMAWPGRAAADAMVAGARTRAAARATAATRRRRSQPLASRRGGSWTTVAEPCRTRSRCRSATAGSSSQGGQLGPEGVGRLHQRGKLVGELDRTPVQQGVELVVQLVWLWPRHPHRSSSS